MTAMMTVSLGREISPVELRNWVAQIDLRDGLRFVTQMSARTFVHATDESLRLANSHSLAILAKAMVLWADPNGRPLRRSATQEEEGLLLLAAANSLPWHSRHAAETDTDRVVLSMLIRQAYQRVAADDPLDGLIARTWMMFHDIISEGGFDVADPSAELVNEFGVSAEDLWTLCLAVFSFYATITNANPNRWTFDPSNFVAEGPRREEINAMLSRVLQRIALSAEEFRLRYAAADSKYRDPSGQDGHWISEFNILRDFPIVRVGPSEYCAPFPIFAFTRGAAGFYFDLWDVFFQRTGRADNAMTTTLGDVFQEYIGAQLRQLDGRHEHLREEFAYGPDLSMQTPDWILARPNQVRVFFECKARRPTLDVQRYARVADQEDELRKGLVKAMRQFARFLHRADNGAAGLEEFAGLERCVLAVVMYEPFPFHCVPDIRRMIERLAAEVEPLWAQIRDRVIFVPMWVRELETAVAAEVTLGIPIESQLEQFASYRESARRIERWEGGLPVFPSHLEEFLQERFHNSRRIANPLCQSIWESFCAFAQRRIFDEDIEIIEQEIRDLTTRRLAYELWERRSCPLWDAFTDWHQAELILGFAQ
jgi:hypothetical protein